MNPPSLWQPDLSEYVTLWHGCTTSERVSIERRGVDLSRCRVNTDFGRGFYTTTLRRQAAYWAMHSFGQRLLANGGRGDRPVVLRFRVRRYGVPSSRRLIDQGLDKLLSLHFVRGDHGNEDYWSLVHHCRQSRPDALNDHRRPPGGWYDVVTGPVAAFWEQRVAMADSDQVSFHTAKAIRLLDALIESRDPANYRWFAVPVQRRG
jgi:hypothetical protein